MRKALSLRRKLLVLPICAAFIGASACDHATIVSDLNTAVSTIQVALPIIEAAGLISGPLGVAIQVAAAAVDSAATELASKDSNLQKAQFVNTDIQKALSELPAANSLPPNVAPRVAALQAALQAVLVDIQQNQHASGFQSFSLSRSDRNKLKDIAKEAAGLAAQVKH